MLANPIGAAIAAMALAIALSYIIIKNWDKIKEVAIKVWGTVATAAQSAWDATASVFSAAVDWFASKYGAVRDIIVSIWNSIVTNIQSTWESITAIFSGAVDWFAGIFSGIVDAVAGPFMAAFDKISAGWQKVKSFFGFDSAGGITGGLNYVGGLGGAPIGGNASQSISPASVRNSSNSYQSDTSVSVGKVEVVTQATDAQGISKDIGKGLQKDLGARFKANQANVGVVQ